MDSTSANRYDLLCMDDDASDPLETLVRKKAKQQKQQQQQHKTATGPSINAGNAGGLAEKENKSAVMNKNVEKNVGGYGAPSAAAASLQKQQKGNNLTTTTNQSTAGQAGHAKEPSGNYRTGQDQQQRTPREGKNYEQQRNVNFKSNAETREQHNNRRNRDDRQYQNQVQQQNGNIAGEYHSNMDRPQRQQRIGGGGGGGGSGFGSRDGGGGAQRRNFDAQNRGGKREFDRQSGSDKTGVKAVDKRDGGGAHNWGSHKQDLDDLNKTTEEVGTDKDDSAGEQQTEQIVSIEEETKEITLDEWKAQRAVRAKPQFNIRKAGEGEDLSQWKKMVALNNKKRDDESEEELEYDPSMYPQRVGRLQRVLDIEFHFNDGRRGGGIGGRGRGRPRGQPGSNNQGGIGRDGGGSGGGPRREGRVPRNSDPMKTENIAERNAGGERHHRGGGGGGGGSGAHPQQHGGQHAPKVDDEHDFPSLG